MIIVKGEKMKKNISLIITTLILIGSIPGFSQDKVGTSAAPFLGINIGAAATAMGGAYVSNINDASSLYWNPGAITRLGGTKINITHTEWFLGTSYDWGGVVLDFDGISALGFQLAVLNYGEEDVTTIHAQQGTGERWDAQDLFASISYARNLTDRFSIGGSAKIIQQQIYHESATGYAIDIGLLYITQFNGMRLGMSISNFGTDMQMDGKDLLHTYDEDSENLGNNPTISSKKNTAEWALPIFFRVGISMDVIGFEDNTLSVSTDSWVPSDNSTIVNVGVEYNFKEIFFLRGGYQSIGRQDTQEGLTAGFGFKYNIAGLAKVNLDYAFQEFGLLEDVHTFGFGFSM
jgi:hypothetical protein